MFWVVASCSEYAYARLSLRLGVLRTRSQGATGDQCLVTVTPEHPTSPVLPEGRSTEGWHAATTQLSDLADHPQFALAPMELSWFVQLQSTEAF